jgi:hypothetical protein
MKRQLQLWTVLSALVLTSTVSVLGQTQQKAAVERSVVVARERSLQSGDAPQDPAGLSDKTITFIASEMSFDGKLVKGAPYSAQGVTETIQTLGDGNRIVNKSTSSVYRDSEGRTRREHTLQAIGPFANSGEPVQTISINDPVGGVNYSLDTRTHVAHKMLPMRFEFKMGNEGNAEFHSTATGTATNIVVEKRVANGRGETETVDTVGVAPQVFMRTAPGGMPTEPGMVMQWHDSGEKNAKKESLGKQSVEGVEAEGTRTTVTIPAGEMGNERPIEIVSESWYSPELQVVVMTRHSDPRFGETTYRLTNINRSEPAKSLFEIPADYKVEEAPMRGPMQPMRMRKPMEQ